jgi:GAF domain-containing protein
VQAEQALAKRASELETVAQVSTAASTILNTGQLLQQVADLTKERFELYHAHIYLLDEDRSMLNLTAGAGDVGRQMVAQGWSIPLEREQSLVARAARDRQGVTSNDVQAEPDFMPNPLLPDTRSELAVPMLVGGRVLGVLDVQAEDIDHFTEEDIRIQTTLAAQIAVALENARLLQQTQTRAHREQILREITDRIRGSVDMDTILRTTAQEVGRALDRPAFVYLGNKDNGQSTQPASEKKEAGNE